MSNCMMSLINWSFQKVFDIGEVTRFTCLSIAYVLKFSDMLMYL